MISFINELKTFSNSIETSEDVSYCIVDTSFISNNEERLHILNKNSKKVMDLSSHSITSFHDFL